MLLTLVVKSIRLFSGLYFFYDTGSAKNYQKTGMSHSPL